MTIFASVISGLPRAWPDDGTFEQGGWHTAKGYPGAEQFLGVSHGLKRVSELVAQGYKIVPLPQRALSERSPKSSTIINELLVDLPAKPPCKTLYRITQPFWSQDWTVIRHIWAGHLAYAFAGKRPSYYRDDMFTIAVHARYGDSPRPGEVPEKFTTVDWMVSIAKQIVDTVKAEGVPVQIFIFSAGDGDVSKFTTAFPESVLLKNTTAMETIMHFAAADVLLCSSSSLCWNTAFGIARPLILFPFPTRENSNPCLLDGGCVTIPKDEKTLTPHTKYLVSIAAWHWNIRKARHCPYTRTFPPYGSVL